MKEVKSPKKPLIFYYLIVLGIILLFNVVIAPLLSSQKIVDVDYGTWGIEYTTCQKCGYHNWTRQGNVYVCDTCGNKTTTVVGPKGVKGYVGSGAIAAVAPKASAPETRYATAAEAQAAAVEKLRQTEQVNVDTARRLLQS